MIPLMMIVDDVLPKRMTERLLAEQDELRETFLFDGLHPALRERVQIRAPCGQLDGRDANLSIIITGPGPDSRPGPPSSTYWRAWSAREGRC